MPLRETEAIVLRTYRLGEADKIASLFTRQWGRLRAVARGARRPKSRFGSAFEPLSYIRLWLFERENRDLLSINSAELLESFFEMQKEYGMQVAAQYIAEVSERYFPEREMNDRAFRLLLAVLRALKHGDEVDRPLVYFDYWLLRLAGFLPDLKHCSACGRVLEEEPGFYGPGSEGLRCSACRTSSTDRPVSRQARDLAEKAREAPLDRWLKEVERGPLAREARHFLEEVIEVHGEKKIVTRSLLE